MNDENQKTFLEDYEAFLQINALLYHPSTCAFTEPTELYPELIQGLVIYIDTMTEAERDTFNTSEAQEKFGTIHQMRHFLLQQYDRLEQSYDLSLEHFNESF